MDYWELARQAIEAVVAKRHPEASDNWSAIKPMSDNDGWGLSLARWSTEARQIIRKFNALIGGEIAVPNSAIHASGEKSLDSFQSYLAAKAQIKPVSIMYFHAKATLLEWEE